MTRSVRWIALIAMVAVLSPAAGAAAGKGEKVFKKCKACHQVGPEAKHKVGPHLNDLFGRRAAGLEDFTKYSKAMTTRGGEGLVWNSESLTGFLTKPKTYLKGTRMSFPGLRKPGDIEALLEFLATYDAQGRQ